MTSLGKGCEDRKLLLLFGTELAEEKARLYADWLPWNSNGLWCGEL